MTLADLGFAGRVADAAMPGVGNPDRTTRKLDAYRAALEMALADGVVTRLEERALAKLEVKLAIDAEQALALHEAERRAGVATPPA